MDIEKQRSTQRGQPQMPVLVFFGDNLCINWIDNAVRVLSHASFISYPGMLFVEGISNARVHDVSCKFLLSVEGLGEFVISSNTYFLFSPPVAEYVIQVAGTATICSAH